MSKVAVAAGLSRRRHVGKPPRRDIRAAPASLVPQVLDVHVLQRNVVARAFGEADQISGAASILECQVAATDRVEFSDDTSETR